MLVSFVMTLAAQNPFTPFRTNSSVIMDFNLSPDGRRMVYKERSADGFVKILLKDLKKGYTTLVSDKELADSEASELFSGMDFLTKDVLLLAREGYMNSCHVGKKQTEKLFKLPDDLILAINVSPDGKGVYWVGEKALYYSLLTSEPVIQSHPTKGGVLSMTINKNGHAFYTTADGIFCWDGLNAKSEAVTAVAELVSHPYLIEATRHQNRFIVTGKDGVFKVDLAKGKTEKLMDNEKENPVLKMRLSPNGKVLYYQKIHSKHEICELVL